MSRMKQGMARALAAVGAVVGLTASAWATDPVTLPQLGVDVEGAASAMGGDLGRVFMAVLTISVVFIIGKIGWRWLRRAGS